MWMGVKKQNLSLASVPNTNTEDKFYDDYHCPTLQYSPRVPGARHNVLLVHVHTPNMIPVTCQGPNLALSMSY